MSDGAPIKVAIIGGGCASIAAAFELTRPEHEGRYEVTIYQVGWRLGGKGASGRGPAGRIEEHGLHLWMGWYENAFRLMRECYAELGRDPEKCPIADWRDAFEPFVVAGLTDVDEKGAWQAWQAALPPNEGSPGDPSNGSTSWSLVDYMTRALQLLRALLETMAEKNAAFSFPTPPLGAGDFQQLLRYGEIASLTGVLQAVAALELAVGSLGQYPQNAVVGFLDTLARGVRAQLESRLAGDAATRRVWQVIDLTFATLRGVIRAGVMTDPRGLDALDEYDAREWLLLNGASQLSVDSAWLRGMYDFGFSYEDGDVTRPRIAASQGVRSMLRAFFTSRGAFFWRMNAGMGDIVFAPFYQVLKRRGARFAFFHRLENVKLSAARPGDGGSPFVEALEMSVQAEVEGGGEYEPLVDVGGLPCWPSVPDWAQLVGGERMRAEGWELESHWERRRARALTLRVGDDFDLVVLGIGLGAVPHVCSEIVASNPRWRAMVDHVKTVATQAFQIWMDVDMRELGWQHGPTVLTGFVEPFDTWADMRHLIGRESWPQQPRALGYFCSCLADAPEVAGEDPYRSQRELVRANAVRFLERDIAHLWPNALRDGSFRWEVLVDPEGKAEPTGEARLATQFWTANVNPSDRYALSLPGSSAYRISPLDPTYDNLTICGDWTSCSFNAGCVEAAVMSGRLAAHALSQSPRLEDIVGYDHP